MVLASTGAPFSDAALRAAADAARATPDGGLAVVSIARLHGYALGMPNPGLLPTPREKAAQADVVDAAIRRLRGWGLAADGQVIVTRNAAKAIAGVARRRAAGHVVLQAGAGSRLRRLVEGDAGKGLTRRLRRHCPVTIVAG